ncbi:MAG: glycosyltransferase family 9 protein [Acidobacteria bacterium]|nr:glycosyltransferase family 9 protein [Acidobacteriota bacterium]
MRHLLIRPGAVGDFLVSLPAMERLRGAYTEVWTASPNVPLARFADAAFSIASTGLDLLEFAPPERLIERLRGFDRIVSWYGSARTEFREAVARWGLPFEFLAALPDGRSHAVDFYLAQVGAEPGAAPRIECPAAREDFAVIHPFASRPAKRWPLERFREVARRLPMPVRWCAGPEEELEDAVRIPDLYDLACWLARARVYIGNDSGIAHLAAAAGTPVVALFGPTDPAVWAPRGPRVRVLAPMGQIRVEEVIAAAGQ